MDILNYLNLYDVLVNEIVGSLFLFILLSIIIICVVGAWFSFQWDITVMLTLIFLGIMFGVGFGSVIGFWVAGVLISTLIFFYGISVKISRAR